MEETGEIIGVGGWASFQQGLLLAQAWVHVIGEFLVFFMLMTTFAS